MKKKKLSIKKKNPELNSILSSIQSWVESRFIGEKGQRADQDQVVSLLASCNVGNEQKNFATCFLNFLRHNRNPEKSSLTLAKH